jgi:uncharacterized protein YdeI (YjbR/CyaY-like superfamily)
MGRPKVAAVAVDPDKVHEFADGDAFCSWLERHHASESEVWIKLHKVGSGLPSIRPKEAVDAVLCWGWIDGIRKGFDDKSFLQRYTPRTARSIWSKINVDNVARLLAAGRMTEHGLKQVAAAKADGRWDRAYRAGKDLQIAPDFQAAIDAEPLARAMLAKLTEQNRFALAFRVHTMKTAAGRQKKIATFVEMLKRGETIYPQRKR